MAQQEWRKNHSLSFDGISHRVILKRLINQRDWIRGAEIGVEKGVTYLHLLEHCPYLTLLGVDVWEPQPEKDSYRDEGGYSYLEDDLPGHERRLRQIVAEKYPERGVMLKAKSVDAAKQIEDDSLDFVFIDASHLEEDVRADIEAWRPKVKSGGLLMGHDLHFPGVKRAVDALCPEWFRLPQEVWAITCGHRPLLITSISYADDRNLGRAYNETMALLPDGGWACLVDHDAVFTTPEWHRQLTDAVLRKPQGCFTVMTNRIKCPYQRAPGVDPKNHDIKYHRALGDTLRINHVLRDVTDDREPSGVVIVISKQAWRDVGGFPEGLHYVDRIMWMALKLAGRRIYLIEGVYVYHWHRGGGESFQRGEWAVEHMLPNGKGIKLVKSKEELPVYG